MFTVAPFQWARHISYIIVSVSAIGGEKKPVCIENTVCLSILKRKLYSCMWIFNPVVLQGWYKGNKQTKSSEEGENVVSHKFALTIKKTMSDSFIWRTVILTVVVSKWLYGFLSQNQLVFFFPRAHSEIICLLSWNCSRLEAAISSWFSSVRED